MQHGEQRSEWLGLAYGFLGVAAFSLTLPMTRVAVAAFGPTLVGLGRALCAAVLAAGFLWARRERLPARADWPGLLLVAVGVILGFPLLSAWAMGRVDASHGGVILGLLPLATAGAAVLRGGERPSLAFWLASLAGSAAVVLYALSAGAGSLQLADLALLGAVVLAALGYAEGGRLARHLGGLQVISWALLLTAPVAAVAVAVAWGRHDVAAASPGAWGSFAYLSVISQFLGFAAWYGGLALGGVARVSQIQLLQPFLTLVGAALLLGESITLVTVGAAVLVLLTVGLGRRTAVRRTAPAQWTPMR